MSVVQRSSADPRVVRGPASRVLTRLSDESGIALVMAIVVMFVLTILVTAALAYTSSDSRDASRSSATQKAYAAAEAGVNNAIAVVQKAGSDPTGVPGQPPDPSAISTSLSGGGTATWGASYNAATKVWTVKSVGAVPNPTGPTASTITRTLTQTVTITPPPYTFVALNSSCDNHTLLVESSGQLNVTNAMYIDSCSNGDAFDIFGPGGNIADPAGIKVVGGWETHSGDTVSAPTLCPLSTNSATNPQPAGCPITSQPILPDPLAGKVSPPTLGSAACTGATQTSAVAYSPAVTLNSAANITTTATSLPIKWAAGSGDPVLVNDVIQIDSEQMVVTAITPVTGTTATLTVTRGTPAATHAKTAPVSKVLTTVLGTAANPAPCLYTSGTVTFNPGTYYGGICIGSVSTANCDGANCSTTSPAVAYSPAVALNAAATINTTATSLPIKWASGSDPVLVNDVIQIDSEQMVVTAITPLTGTTATLTVTRGTPSATHAKTAAVSKVPPPPHVSATLNPGTYIMAGGGFRVCGSSTLSAPNVMIYNTQDPTVSTGFGALDQIELNTTGSVSLGPPLTGPYQGLTLFQDRSLALAAGQTCNSRNNTSSPTQAQIDAYDIALMSAASTGSASPPMPSGSLGSISGSIYAPANNADFADFLSGTANLAVLTSCILVEGGNSTFAFDPQGLFGTGWALGSQAG